MVAMIVHLVDGGVVSCPVDRGELLTERFLHNVRGPGTAPLVNLGSECMLWVPTGELLHLEADQWEQQVVAHPRRVLEKWQRNGRMVPFEPPPRAPATGLESAGPQWTGDDGQPRLVGPGLSCGAQPGAPDAWRPVAGIQGDLGARSVGACVLGGRWRDDLFWFVVYDAAGVVHQGRWSLQDAIAADARLAWARVLASAAEHPTVPDVATTPSPVTAADAEAAFADACARQDWRLGVWALRGASPDRLVGVVPEQVLGGCPAAEGAAPGTP